MKQRRHKRASAPGEGQSANSAAKSAATTSTSTSTSKAAADYPPFEDSMAAIRATIAKRKEEAQRQGLLASQKFTKTQATAPTTTTKGPDEARAQGQQRGGISTEAPAHRKMGQQLGGTSTGAQALGQGTTRGLERELEQKIRLPKPRSTSSMDEDIWQGASRSAKAEILQQYAIVGELEEYYESMCKVGRQLLVDRIQEKTQGMYDYRATKARSKAIKAA